MTSFHVSRRGWALFFARAVLGLIFFMAGVWKVFVLTPAGHVRKFFLPFEHTFLPLWSLWLVGSIIPFVELLGGGFMLLGLFRKPACLGLGAVLVTVTFGHLLENPLYAFNEHVIPRLALLLFVLLMPWDEDRLAIDEWIATRVTGHRSRVAGRGSPVTGHRSITAWSRGYDVAGNEKMAGVRFPISV